jgi:hypothetical protein
VAIDARLLPLLGSCSLFSLPFFSCPGPPLSSSRRRRRASCCTRSLAPFTDSVLPSFFFARPGTKRAWVRTMRAPVVVVSSPQLALEASADCAVVVSVERFFFFFRGGLL